MGYIAGVDFSSFQVDVCLLSEDDDTATHHVFPFGLKGEDAFDRARRVREALPSRSWWADQGVFAVGIEDPRGAARNVDSVLYRVQGAVLACLPMELAVCPWKPLQWRKIIGVEMRGKETIAEYARERWTNMPDGASQDACDAFAIAAATRERITRSAAA